MTLALTPPKQNPLEMACFMAMRLASRPTMSTAFGRRVGMVEIEGGRRSLVRRPLGNISESRLQRESLSCGAS
jgi:hypothetical protein